MNRWTSRSLSLSYVLNHRFLLPSAHLCISLALVPSLLSVLGLKAVLAPPGPAAALRAGVKDHARVINESLRKMTLSYCCLCFCIMDEGRNEEWVREGKKRESCALFWFCGGWTWCHSSTHCCLAVFFSTSVFLMFSVSIWYIHPFDLLDHTVFVETKGSFTLNVLFHCLAFLLFFYIKMIDMFDCCGCVPFQIHCLQLHSFLYKSILCCTAAPATFIVLFI